MRYQTTASNVGTLKLGYTDKTVRERNIHGSQIKKSISVKRKKRNTASTQDALRTVHILPWVHIYSGIDRCSDGKIGTMSTLYRGYVHQNAVRQAYENTRVSEPISFIHTSFRRAVRVLIWFLYSSSRWLACVKRVMLGYSSVIESIYIILRRISCYSVCVNLISMSNVFLAFISLA